jgi:hypothetical protein
MEERMLACAFTGHREQKLAPDGARILPAGRALKKQNRRRRG